MCVCVCVCVCVCLSVCSANSAIAPNKKGYHMNQSPMGKILKGILKLNGLFQSYGYFPFIQYIESAICYISEHARRATCILERWDRR